MRMMLDWVSEAVLMVDIDIEIQFLQGFEQEFLHLILPWQLQLVAGDKQIVIHACQRKLHHVMIFLRTKQYADGRMICAGLCTSVC